MPLPPPKNLTPPIQEQTIGKDGDYNPAWSQHHLDLVDRVNHMRAGVTDGTDAKAGDIGELLTATAGPVSLASGVVTNVASVSLTPGDWDVSGSVVIATGGGTAAGFGAGVTTIDTAIQATFPSGVVAQQISTAVKRVNVTVATTVWVVAIAFFSASATATGTIRARRAR